jgi:alpha-1,6-mannosyltransferase
MRILDVDNGYSPTGGGIRTYHDRKLAFFAERAEHDYALVIPGARDEVESHGPRAQLIRVRGLPVGAGYRAMLSRAALSRVLEDFRPELVEVGSPYVLPHLVRPALARLGAASVGFFHTDYPELFARQPLAYVSARLAARAERLAERHVGFQYRGFTAALGASEHSLARLRAGGVRHTFLTPLGVDLARFHPARRDASLRDQLGVPPGVTLVLFLARLVPEKGLHHVLAAYPALRDPSRFRLAIGGHGPLAGRVDALVRDFPEVIRLPYEPDPLRVAALLASADVVLSLSGGETFGLLTAEALATGTTVITRDRGAAPELARLVGLAPMRGESIDALVDAVREAKPADRAERARRHAIIAARHGWTPVLERFLAVYAEVLALHRSARR